MLAMALHHGFDMRTVYILPFITGRMYALICIGNESGHVNVLPILTSSLRSEMVISINLDCRNLSETTMSLTYTFLGSSLTYSRRTCHQPCAKDEKRSRITGESSTYRFPHGLALVAFSCHVLRLQPPCDVELITIKELSAAQMRANESEQMGLHGVRGFGN